MNFFTWRFATDESIEQHDKVHHPNGYKDGDTCKLRDTVKKQDTQKKEEGSDKSSATFDQVRVWVRICKGQKTNAAIIRDGVAYIGQPSDFTPTGGTFETKSYAGQAKKGYFTIHGQKVSDPSELKFQNSIFKSTWGYAPNLNGMIPPAKLQDGIKKVVGSYKMIF